MTELATDSEDAIVAAAQRRLEERRTELAQQERVEAAAGKRHGERHGVPTPFESPPVVGAVEPRPRRGKRPFEQHVPAGLAALANGLPSLLYVVPPPDVSDGEISRRIRSALPPTFVGVSWSNVADLRRGDGGPSLGAVELDDGRELRGAAAARYVWERTRDARRVVLIGETGSGKSLVMAALAEAELRRGSPFVNWTHALALKEPGAVARALASRMLCLDDLGYELHSAKDDSGWLPTLTAPACSLLAELYDRCDRRLIVTTPIELSRMARLYGGGAARRVYEDAVIVRLSRVPAPDQ